MEFELVRRFGVRVIEVETLEHPVKLIREDLALVRSGLDAPHLAAASDWLLHLALRQSETHR